jgi:pimeloyl-ACP methyl ester carboxylesterase
MIFTDRHLDQVAGFVSVDGSVPNQVALFREAMPAMDAFFSQSMAGDLALLEKCMVDVEAGRVGVGTADPDGCLRWPGIPSELTAEFALLNSDSRRFSTASSFLGNIGESATQLINPARSYGAIPLIVLTAGESEMPPDLPSDVLAEVPTMNTVWRREHQNVAELSSHGETRIVPDAGHYIQLQKPEVVSATILEVVEAARNANRRP